MRIACPSCQATYEVPDALIGDGRMLRCAKCGHDWLVTGRIAPADTAAPGIGPEARQPAPAVADAAPVRDPAPGDLPPPTPAQRRPPQVIDPPLPPVRDTGAPRRRVVALWAAWIGSGLILGALGTAAWVYRGPIIEAWPPAARVYLLLSAAGNG
jgi:predicted Zn finger-like uncharacterized protein